MTTLEKVRAVLDRCKFSYSNEKQLQALIEKALRPLVPEGYSLGREVVLGNMSDGDVIDFRLVKGAEPPRAKGLGIEVKTKEPPAKVLRQLERYVQHAEIDELLLITSVPSHGKLPEEINGKKVHVYGLWGKF
jgi:hypothetical protein